LNEPVPAVVLPGIRAGVHNNGQDNNGGGATLMMLKAQAI